MLYNIKYRKQYSIILNFVAIHLYIQPVKFKSSISLQHFIFFFHFHSFTVYSFSWVDKEHSNCALCFSCQMQIQKSCHILERQLLTTIPEMTSSHHHCAIADYSHLTPEIVGICTRVHLQVLVENIKEIQLRYKDCGSQKYISSFPLLFMIGHLIPRKPLNTLQYEKFHHLKFQWKMKILCSVCIFCFHN